MESLQDRSPSSEGGSPSDGSRRGKMGRIAGHTRGLVEDLREWIDLRIDLAILEMEERIDELRNEVALGIALAFLGVLAVLFVFATIALGLGWLLGHPFWGFLIVSIVLVLTVAALAQLRPPLMPPSNFFEKVRGGGEDAVEDSRPAPEAATGDGAETTSASNGAASSS